jgi:phospholipase/lecithinase/hemolysin
MRVRITLLVAAAVLTVASATTTAQSPFDRIVVFGTSLSDSGNAFALRGGTNVPPDYLVDPLLVPSAPYARGGHHFTNGATWVEQFGRSVGLAGSVRPAFVGGDVNATNYAVGAARAWEDGLNLNLSTQVSTFLRQYGGVAPADALYVIEMGGNDIRDALVAYSKGQDGSAILRAAVISIASSVAKLHAAGARQFLVWRAPNVALTPAIRALNVVSPGAVQLGTFLTQSFNAALDGAAFQLGGLPGIDIARLDASELLQALVDDGSAFGLTHVTMACLTPNVAPFTCVDPDEYLFWDGIHPTSAVHGIIATEALSVLVP